MTTLQKGSRGEEVKVLQKKLNLIADGIFGAITDETVRAFQKSNGLTPDGIVGNKTWAKLGFETNPRRINKIIVHCSATPEGEDYTVANIREMHLARKFSDVGYHYIIYRDGSIHKGRPEAQVGAHTTGYNSNSIGVCYIGGCPSRSVPDWNKKAKDTRTEAQKASLISLLKDLRAKYPNATIHGHREFANKGCPSFDARKEYANL